MQCNHSFCGSPFSSFGQQCAQQCGQQCVQQCHHCNTANPCKSPRPEVVGEGDVTTLVLPDGTTQMYFIPASPSNKCCPVPFNQAFGNCLQYPVLNQPIYFIRSISNPVPLLHQTQPSPYGFPYPRPPFECRPNIPLPPPTQLQFHNDNCTSTSDLRYFFPQSRCCPKTTNHCAAIQASAPIDTGTCPGSSADHCAASQAPSAMETGTCPDMVILEQAKHTTSADIQTSDVNFCNCASSSKNKKPHKIKKSRSASMARKSRHKIKKKKSRAECECYVLSDTSLELSSSSKTSIKSCTSCSSCQSGYKNKKKAKKSKKRKRRESKNSVTSSTQSCTISSYKSDVSDTTSQTSASSKNEPKQKKQKKEKIPKEKKQKKNKVPKEKKPKKEKIPKEKKPKKEKQHKEKKTKNKKVNKSTSPTCNPSHSLDFTIRNSDEFVPFIRKSSTNTNGSSGKCCSNSSIQSASNIKEEKQPKKGKEKKLKDGNIKNEMNEKKSKLKKEMKEQESMHRKEFKEKISQLKKEMKEKESELNREMKEIQSKVKNDIKKTESKSKKEKPPKVKKQKTEPKYEVHREETEMTENLQQTTTEDSDDLCDCSRVCSSTATIPEEDCNCCNNEAFLKKDFCCMTSQQSKLDKKIDMDCLFQSDLSSDVTSYIADLDLTVPCQMVVWYPDNSILNNNFTIKGNAKTANDNLTTATNNTLTADDSFTTDNYDNSSVI